MRKVRREISKPSRKMEPKARMLKKMEKPPKMMKQARSSLEMNWVESYLSRKISTWKTL